MKNWNRDLSPPEGGSEGGGVHKVLNPRLPQMARPSTAVLISFPHFQFPIKIKDKQYIQTRSIVTISQWKLMLANVTPLSSNAVSLTWIECEFADFMKNSRAHNSDNRTSNTPGWSFRLVRVLWLFDAKQSCWICVHLENKDNKLNLSSHSVCTLQINRKSSH